MDEDQEGSSAIDYYEILRVDRSAERSVIEAAYPVMRELETSHPDVAVGSYPNFQSKELTIRFTGQAERRVQEAMEVVRLRVAPMGLTPIA